MQKINDAEMGLLRWIDEVIKKHKEKNVYTHE